MGNPRFKPALSEAFSDVKELVTSTIPPIQIEGQAGDVILTHGRTFHMGSRNFSSQIRQAIFYDVVKMEVDAKFSAQLDDEGEPERGYKEWHDWSEEVRDEVAQQEREDSAGAGGGARL